MHFHLIGEGAGSVYTYLLEPQFGNEYYHDLLINIFLSGKSYIPKGFSGI